MPPQNQDVSDSQQPQQSQPTVSAPISEPLLATPPQSMRPAGRKKRVLLFGAIALVSVTVISGVLFWTYNRQQSGGLKRADEFVALLEAGDQDALKSEVMRMLGTNENTTDPGEISAITGAATQTAFVVSALQSADAERYDSSFGTTPEGKKLVTAYYRFPVAGETGFYTVEVRQEGSVWELSSINYSADNPVGQ